MDITLDFSSGSLILLFILSMAVIYLFLYLLRIYTPLIFSEKINANKFRKFFTIFQGSAWSLFILSSAFFSLKHNIIFASLLFIVLLMLIYWYSQYAIRDIIAGFVFKSETRFSLNEVIEIEGQKGEIKKFHYRNIEIESENGRRILIPYSMLLGVISSPQKISENVLNYSFEITIPTEQPFEKVADKLKIYIFSLPWAVLKNDPKIQLIKEIDKIFVVKITLFSFDEYYFQPMRKRIESYVEENL